jgi:hypothetical protein
VEPTIESLILNPSGLNRTWILDLDGTLLQHRGYQNDGDRVLPGVAEFYRNIPKTDHIVILTARSSSDKKKTIEFLNDQGLWYDYILFDMPVGERVLLNDRKPSGMQTAFAVNLDRDRGL